MWFVEKRLSCLSLHVYVSAGKQCGNGETGLKWIGEIFRGKENCFMGIKDPFPWWIT